MSVGPFQKIKFFFQIGSAHLLQVFFQALQPFFDLPQVTDHQVEIDVLDVAKWIDRPDVRNGRIIEGADHVGQGVHIAQVPDVGAFFQSFLANGAHVHIFDRCVSQLFRVVKRRQAVEALVRNFGHPDVGLARVRVGLVGKMRLGENAEQRSLAYLRQANDASFHRDQEDDNSQ